jgi:hypothetical protein
MVENMHSFGFDEWQQLEAFIKVYIKSHREQKKCIVGALGPDFSTLNETTKTELKRMVEIILKWLTELLEKGRAKNIFAFSDSPEGKAFFIFSSLVASLQLSNIIDKMDYKSFHQSILDDLKP